MHQPVKTNSGSAGAQGNQIRFRVKAGLVRQALYHQGVYAAPPGSQLFHADESTSKVIAQSKIDHDEEPNETGSDEKPGERRALTDMHENKDYQKHLCSGYDQSRDGIERTQVDLSNSPGQKKQDH